MLEIRAIQDVKGWQIFWDAVGVFGDKQYEEELKLERALCHCTGYMAVLPGVIPDDPLDQLLMGYEFQTLEWFLRLVITV